VPVAPAAAAAAELLAAAAAGDPAVMTAAAAQAVAAAFAAAVAMRGVAVAAGNPIPACRRQGTKGGKNIFRQPACCTSTHTANCLQDAYKLQS
jgi:hypothetical protein